MKNESHSSIQTYLCILGTLILWGAAFPAVRFGLMSAENAYGFTPGALALLRFLVSSSIAIVYLTVTRQGLPRKKDLPRLMIAGFTGIFLYHFLFNFGEIAVESGAAAALIGSSPIFVALLSVVFLKERLSIWGWVGVLCSFLGVLIIGFLDVTGFKFDIYALSLLGSALATAIFFTLSKDLLKTYSGMRFTCYAFIAGVIPLLIFSPALARELPNASTGALSAVFFLGIFPGFIGYSLWNAALTRMPATRLAVFLSTNPIFAAAIAWVWLKEVPNVPTVIGSIVAVIGVLLVQLLGDRKKRS